jgi:hypothetical protein
MKRRIWVIALVFAVLAGYGMTVAPPAIAYTKSWDATCINVAGNQRGLWDDMPGVASGGDANEAGLFWVVVDDANDEQCSYLSNFSSDVSATNFRNIRARVAISDGARFTVTVLDTTEEFCSHTLASYTTPSTWADGSFRNLDIVVPPGYDICALKITLDDNPNSVNAGRLTALIDYIWVWDGTNTIGWAETFSGGHP